MFHSPRNNFTSFVRQYNFTSLAVLHHIKFKEFHVDWNAADKVYFFSEAKSSKLYRAVGQKLGLSKSEYVVALL